MQTNMIIGSTLESIIDNVWFFEKESKNGFDLIAFDLVTKKVSSVYAKTDYYKQNKEMLRKTLQKTL